MASVYGLYLKHLPDEIRYIGVTHYSDITKRLNQHIYAAIKRKSKYPVHLWIKKHIELRDVICISVVHDNLGNEEALIKEKEYVAIFKKNGSKLLNATDGGRGSLGLSQEAREKISKAHKGKPKSPEQRKIMAYQARNHSPEARRKMSEANKGRVVSKETRQKLSKARKGKKPHPNASSPEARAKISKALKGRVFSEEHRRNISKAVLSRPPVSDETKEKQRIASTGKRHSEESKRKMSEIHKNRREFTPEEKAAISKKISDSRKGKPSWNKGKSFSPEQRQRMSEAAKRRFRSS